MSQAFRKLLRNTDIRILHLVYSFYGSANGQIKEYRYSVPIRVGSFKRGGYFVDQRGEDIELL